MATAVSNTVNNTNTTGNNGSSGNATVPNPSAADPSAIVTTHIPGVINPYENVRLFHHRKFISNIGIAFIDLKTTEGTGLMRQPRTVLRKISGQVNYGTLNVVRGPRRSGKTTLIKTLAGRNNQGVDPDSQLYINEDIQPRVVLMEKEMRANILFSLTPEELINFSYRLRNKSLASAERRRAVRELMRTFDLVAIADLPLTYCTNEERVRAEVAMILATVPEDRPNLIFLDEPLYELDAVGIENTVSLLKRVSRQYSIGITFAVGQILDSDILAVFDKLYVLSIGGLCVYEGSVEHLLLYLREAGVLITTQIQTPMERLIKVASKPSAQTMHLASQTGATRADVLHMAQRYGIPAPDGVQVPRPRVNFRNINALFARGVTHQYRTYWKTYLSYLGMIAAMTVVLTTAFDDNIGAPSSCYNRTGRAGSSGQISSDPKEQQSSRQQSTVGRFSVFGASTSRVTELEQQLLSTLQDRSIDVIDRQSQVDENVKFLFVITAGMTLLHLVTSVDSIDEEVKVVVNEHRNGWVNVNSYFLVKNVISLVMPVVNTVTCSSLAYWLTGQVGDPIRFLVFTYAQLAGVLCAQSLGFIIGIISVFNSRFTSLLMVASFLVFLVFSGYLIPMDEIAKWLQGLTYTSFIKLSFELTLLSIYGLGRCTPVHLTNSYVLDEFGINSSDVFLRNSLLVLGHLVAYRLVFWVIMFSKVNKKSTIDRHELVLADKKGLGGGGGGGDGGARMNGVYDGYDDADLGRGLK